MSQCLEVDSRISRPVASSTPYLRPWQRAAALWLSLTHVTPTVPVAAEPLLSDQQSDVYYHFAVAAGGQIQVEEGTGVTGNVHSNDKIDLKPGSQVSGDVSATGEIVGDGTVLGNVLPGVAPVDLPELDDPASLLQLADRIFSGDQVLTDEVIDDVIFVEGKVEVFGSLDGTGTIIATAEIHLMDGAVGLDGATRLSLISFKHIEVGKDRPIRAVLRARESVIVEEGAAVEGVIVADQDVTIKKDSAVTFLDFDEAPPMVTLVSPEDGAVLDASPTEIVAAWSDDFSGVDPTTAQVLLDGVDRTAEAVATDTGITLALAEMLLDGAHTVEIAVSDNSGKRATCDFSFEVDAGPDLVPPDLNIVSPADGAELNDSPDSIELAFSDADSGIDPTSLRLFLDEIDLSTACDPVPGGASCLTFNVPLGGHHLEAEIRDLAGNVAAASAEFTVILPGAPPLTEITTPEPGGLTNAGSVVVAGRVFTTGSIVQLTVNDLPVTLEGDSFQAEIPVAEGFFTIVVRAVDAEGQETLDKLEIQVDQTPPELVVEQPSDGQVSNVPQIVVRGYATVAPDPIVFETTVSLVEGGNPITIVASDLLGNEVTGGVSVEYQPSLEVTVTEPADQLQATADAVTVIGTVSGNPAEVEVAGLPATLDGDAFSADVPLVLGSNPIAVVARDAAGRIGKAVVTVFRDTSPPRIVFSAPTDGEVVFEPAIDVSGLINDIIGTVAPAAEGFTVTVNGQPAVVAGDTFSLASVPLQPGVNLLTATVVDESGNEGESSVSVRLETAATARLLRISGSGQAATIRSSLAAPLVVQAVDAGGQPVAAVPVVFQVTEGDGQLAGGERQAAVFTGTDGLASIGFTTGRRAGRGNHVVEATAVGFAGTARFFSDALPGEVAAVVVGTGTQQLGITGQRLPVNGRQVSRP